MRFAPAPEYPVFPTRERPLKPYEAVVLATAETRPVVAAFAPDAVVHDILTLAPAMAAELEGVPVATLVPHVYPVGAPGCRRTRWARGCPRTRPAARLWRHLTRWSRRACAAGRERAQRDAAQLGLPPVSAAARRDQRAAVPGRDVPAARVSARLGAERAGGGAVDVGAAVRRRRAAAGRRAAGAGGAVDRAGPRAPAAPRGARRAGRRAGARAGHLEPPAAARADRVPANARLVEWVSYSRTMPRCDAGDLPRRTRDAGAGARLRHARWWASRTPATWPRTPRGSTGRASGCGCRGGC